MSCPCPDIPVDLVLRFMMIVGAYYPGFVPVRFRNLAVMVKTGRYDLPICAHWACEAWTRHFAL